MARTITLAHSPDAGNAFMFYALAKGKIETHGLHIEREFHDIESLNRRATDGVYEVTSLSFAAYPGLRKKYALLSCGANVGDGCGPVVVSKRSLTRQGLDEVRIAVPGEKTTAFLLLQLFSPGIQHKVVMRDRILDEVSAGHVDAGLMIHEGQMLFGEHKLTRVVDLGEWWKMGTGLPVALGGTAVRRDLDSGLVKTIASVVRESVRYGLSHREEALAFALSFDRGLDHDRADKFVGMYVNDYTVDLGTQGRNSVETLFRYGHDAGLIPELVSPEFVA